MNNLLCCKSLIFNNSCKLLGSLLINYITYLNVRRLSSPSKPQEHVLFSFLVRFYYGWSRITKSHNLIFVTSDCDVMCDMGWDLAHGDNDNVSVSLLTGWFSLYNPCPVEWEHFSAQSTPPPRHWLHCRVLDTTLAWCRVSVAASVSQCRQHHPDHCMSFNLPHC